MKYTGEEALSLVADVVSLGVDKQRGWRLVCVPTSGIRQSSEESL
jgi:hypothetical protein